MDLRILTYNTLFAGQDGHDTHRAKAQIQLINSISPHVFLMQEAKGFAADGNRLLHSWENQIGMRGFMAVAPLTGQNVVIFIREPIKPVTFEMDTVHFHHALAILTVSLPGLDRMLTLMSTHLCPNSPLIRQREAAYLTVRANPDQLVLLTGDFNSVSPHDPEPTGFTDLSAHHRIRYLSEDQSSADRTVLRQLETAGWVDIGYTLDPSITPTVPAAGFTNTEFARMRCDYVLASKSLAAYATEYQVICSPLTDSASDHYPVLTTFILPD